MTLSTLVLSIFESKDPLVGKFNSVTLLWQVIAILFNKPELDSIFNGEEIQEMPTPSFYTVILQKEITDLIFWAEIFTMRYPTVNMTFIKISARFNVQNQK